MIVPNIPRTGLAADSPRFAPAWTGEARAWTGEAPDLERTEPWRRAASVVKSVPAIVAGGSTAAFFTMVVAALLSGLTLPSTGRAQAVVVDQGTFTITLGGEPAGSEEFFVRRSGDTVGSYLANGTIDIWAPNTERTLSVLLTASAPRGVSEGYELTVTGVREPYRVTIPAVTPPRFPSHYVSESGQESREYSGSAETRILEAFVAHHYYFLASLEVGSSVPVIVPSERTSGRVTVAASNEDEIVFGVLSMRARRLLLQGHGGDRLVWFDALGRVVRVELPSMAYVAQRTDLVYDSSGRCGVPD